MCDTLYCSAEVGRTRTESFRKKDLRRMENFAQRRKFDKCQLLRMILIPQAHRNVDIRETLRWTFLHVQ